MGEYREASKGIGFVGAWIIAALVVAAIVGAGFWLFNVVTSEIKGQGDAIIEQNSSENWTAAQARFEELYADVVASDRKITVAAANLALNPEDKTAKDTYLGTVNYCISVVGEYNAEARKFLSEDFRSADLPPQIGINDSNTDCKE